MTQPDDIEAVLGALFAHPSRPIQGYSHRTDWPGEPFQVRLDASALSVAHDLYQRFGDAVQVRVGLFSYPDPNAHPLRLWPFPELPTANEHRDFLCELDGPLTVASGASVTHAVVLTSAMSQPVEVNTNGALGALVCDPVDGRIVGGFVGAMDMPLITFPLTYGQPVRIPLGIGTASFEAALGYTVPPGKWTLKAEVLLSDRRRLWTPPLAFTITEQL